MLKNLSELREIVKKSPKKKLVVAAAHDEHSLEAVVTAAKMKIVDPILVGDKEKMQRIGDKLEIEVSISKLSLMTVVPVLSKASEYSLKVMIF